MDCTLCVTAKLQNFLELEQMKDFYDCRGKISLCVRKVGIYLTSAHDSVSIRFDFASVLDSNQSGFSKNTLLVIKDARIYYIPL